MRLWARIDSGTFLWGRDSVKVGFWRRDRVKGWFSMKASMVLVVVPLGVVGGLETSLPRGSELAAMSPVPRIRDVKKQVPSASMALALRESTEKLDFRIYRLRTDQVPGGFTEGVWRLSVRPISDGADQPGGV